MFVTGVGDADVDVEAERGEIGEERCSVRVAWVLLETRHVKLLSGPRAPALVSSFFGSGRDSLETWCNWSGGSLS